MDGLPLHHSASIAGEALELLPERAIYWPARRMLLVADAHFGKAATFRARGVPVPAGTTAASLEKLTVLTTAWPTERIVFLGDFTHSRTLHGSDTRRALSHWRALHRDVEMVLVRGNHDDPDDRIADAFGIAVVEEPFGIGPFALRHHPAADARGYVLAGHIHPALRLFGRGHDRARLPCFWFGERVGILPAFGGFTGAATLVPRGGERVFVVGEAKVYPLPVRGAR